MKLQRVHISINLCKSPLTDGLFAYEWTINNEAKRTFFENILV